MEMHILYVVELEKCILEFLSSLAVCLPACLSVCMYVSVVDTINFEAACRSKPNFMGTFKI